MVPIGQKKSTQRTAVARSIVVLPPAVLDKFVDEDISTPKGAVFQTAIIAGIMASKKTADLIPLCHGLSLDYCNIHIYLNDMQELIIDCEASTEAKTGVEMEALVGASIAALTVYDMCKSISNDIVIKTTALIKKTGGKNDIDKTIHHP